jgi:hypothetical protein
MLPSHSQFLESDLSDSSPAALFFAQALSSQSKCYQLLDTGTQKRFELAAATFHDQSWPLFISIFGATFDEWKMEGLFLSKSAGQELPTRGMQIEFACLA